jgi:hypothetical protein
MGRLPGPRISLRLAAPAGAVVAVGAVLAGTMLASAAAPNLPRRTPAQLLAAMAKAKLPRAMSATLTESANLGFPALPDIGGASSSPLSLPSLISGTHTFQIWYSGPRQVRIALPVSFGETDLRVNGTQVWLWDSSKQTATHILPPAASHYMRPVVPGSPPRAEPGGAPGAAPVPLTPLQAARRLLALVGPTTRVTVPGTTVVAGRDAYQLAVVPRSSQSLVGRILIAVDARTHLPLSVDVYARGASSPAFHFGFTSLSFARPAASNFAFTPPPGARVKTVHLPGYGTGAVPGAGLGSTELMPDGNVFAGYGNLPGKPGGPARRHMRSMKDRAPTGPRTFGTGWLTVADIPVGQAMAAAGHPGRGIGLAGVLLKAARPVHGAWGSGRLLRTSLLSVLLTSKGQLLAGAVTPAVLYADAAKVS